MSHRHDLLPGQLYLISSFLLPLYLIRADTRLHYQCFVVVLGVSSRPYNDIADHLDVKVLFKNTRVTIYSYSDLYQNMFKKVS